MSDQSAKVFSAKTYFHQFAKVFSLESFPLYGIFLTHYLARATTIVCGYLLERTTQMVSTSFSLRATFRAPSRSQLPPPCSREDSHWCASVEHLQERRQREWYSQKMALETSIQNCYSCHVQNAKSLQSVLQLVLIPDLGFSFQILPHSFVEIFPEQQDKISNGMP